MPKFTLIKHPDHETDSEISVQFSTDELGLAKDHFDDFMKASGFELPMDDRMSDFVVRSPSEWMWDDDGEFQVHAAASAINSILDNPDIIQFPTKND